MIITKNQLAESMGNFHLLSPISILDQCVSMQCIPMAKIYLKCDSTLPINTWIGKLDRAKHRQSARAKRAILLLRFLLCYFLTSLVSNSFCAKKNTRKLPVNYN